MLIPSVSEQDAANIQKQRRDRDGWVRVASANIVSASILARSMALDRELRRWPVNRRKALAACSKQIPSHLKRVSPLPEDIRNF
jgi:hypothetical protein